MMAACHTEYEKRLEVNYICPCDLQNLVFYTILDNCIDEAVERAEQWLTSGWSTPNLAIDPIFKLLG